MHTRLEGLCSHLCFCSILMIMPSGHLNCIPANFPPLCTRAWHHLGARSFYLMISKDSQDRLLAYGGFRAHTHPHSETLLGFSLVTGNRLAGENSGSGKEMWLPLGLTYAKGILSSEFWGGSVGTLARSPCIHFPNSEHMSLSHCWDLQ